MEDDTFKLNLNHLQYTFNKLFLELNVLHLTDGNCLLANELQIDGWSLGARLLRTGKVRHNLPQADTEKIALAR